MSPDTPCPSTEALRRSLDPDDAMTEAERRRIEAHVDGCQRGCKQAIDAFLRGNSLPVASEPATTTVKAAPSPPEPAAPAGGKPRPAAGVVAQNEPDAETRALLLRRLIVVFSIIAVMGGAATLAELAAGIKYEWWHWLMPGLWGGLVTLMGEYSSQF